MTGFHRAWQDPEPYSDGHIVAGTVLCPHKWGWALIKDPTEPLALPTMCGHSRQTAVSEQEGSRQVPNLPAP